MTDRIDFHVVASPARWPKVPSQWSYSSLREAEECPRRWALRRASYPEIWAHPGYPPKPVVAALVGDVVHQALEQVLLALHAEAPGQDVTGATVLRGLGGYSALVRQAIDDRLSALEDNPRMAPRIGSLRTLLVQRVPEIRHRVQTVVTRLRFTAAGPPRDRNHGSVSGPASEGSYTEIELRAPQLRFVGRADMLSVRDDAITVIDYKTGEPDPHHVEQLQIYALLWKHDPALNPTARPATTLAIVYATHDEVTAAPNESELEDLRADLISRIDAAEADLTLQPPPARPAPETCRYCPVKHMCEEYWAASPSLSSTGTKDAAANFLDCEGVIARRNGPRSFLLTTGSPERHVLLRTPTETPPFNAGDRVRLIGVALSEDDDAKQRIATITHASEVFVVSS